MPLRTCVNAYQHEDDEEIVLVMQLRGLLRHLVRNAAHERAQTFHRLVYPFLFKQFADFVYIIVDVRIILAEIIFSEIFKQPFANLKVGYAEMVSIRHLEFLDGKIAGLIEQGCRISLGYVACRQRTTLYCFIKHFRQKIPAFPDLADKEFRRTALEPVGTELSVVQCP